jgi:ligand-binding sensor domain-containing protein
MARNGLVAISFICLLIAGTDRAHGLDPSKRLTQYRHSMWRVQDGFLPSNPSWVSQAADGYLLVGGVSIDTFRFDGVRFMPWSSPAVTSNRIRHFFPSKSGGFWITDRRGLSHIRGNLVVSHFDLSAEAIALVEEENGSAWVITNQVGSGGQKGQLCHAGDREIKCFGKADGLPTRLAYSILSDGTGGFWVGSDTSLVHWKAGVSEVYELPGLRSNSGQMTVFLPGIVSLVQNSDGSLWVGISAAGRGLGLERFSNGTFEPFTAPNFDDSKISVLALLLDRDGNLWVATANNGLYRIHGNNADHFGLADGLSLDFRFAPGARIWTTRPWLIWVA